MVPQFLKEGYGIEHRGICFMKKKRCIIPCLIMIWMIMLLFAVGKMAVSPSLVMSREAVEPNLEMSVNEEKTSALVWLKQTIHGTGGVKYRYVVQTDCPSWDFESRYVSDKPLEWVEDETSSVEIIVHDARVSIFETVYASGQYYEAPLLNLSSETISLDQWEEQLKDQAYQAYASQNRKFVFPTEPFIMVPLIGIPVILVIHFLWTLCVAAKTDEKLRESMDNKDEEA